MTQLRDHDWQYSFTSSQDNLLEGFYRPALQEAIRYWRITGYLPGVNYLGLAEEPASIARQLIPAAISC